MSRSGDRSSTPRAVIHKRILDVAGSKPNASMEEIADSISGASTDLVERVLEEYGDPNEDTGSSSADGAASTPTTTNAESGTDEDVPMNEAALELSRKQLDTLHLVEKRPDASQGELAEALGVTRATISRWLNDIPGFEWRRRREIAATLLNDEEMEGPARADEPDPITDLSQRVDAIERRLDELADGTVTAAIDPDLAHKVVHACMKSERITEQEELLLLRKLMN